MYRFIPILLSLQKLKMLTLTDMKKPIDIEFLSEFSKDSEEATLSFTENILWSKKVLNIYISQQVINAFRNFLSDEHPATLCKCCPSSKISICRSSLWILTDCYSWLRYMILISIIWKYNLFRRNYFFLEFSYFTYLQYFTLGADIFQQIRGGYLEISSFKEDQPGRRREHSWLANEGKC